MHRGCAIEKIYTDLLLHSCDSARGDSGSPLLLLERGAVHIIGIHVAILGGENRQGAAVPAATFASANRPR